MTHIALIKQQNISEKYQDSSSLYIGVCACACVYNSLASKKKKSENNNYLLVIVYSAH